MLIQAAVPAVGVLNLVHLVRGDLQGGTSCGSHSLLCSPELSQQALRVAAQIVKSLSLL